MTASDLHFEPEPEDCVEAYAYLNIADPLIAWLVYRGELVASAQVDPSAVSVWASGYLRDAAANGRPERYAAELAIEQMRAANHPRVVSRLRGCTSFRIASQRLKRRSAGADRFGPSSSPKSGFGQAARPARMTPNGSPHVSDAILRRNGWTLTSAASPLASYRFGNRLSTVEHGSSVRN